MKSFLNKIFVSNPTRKHWDYPIYFVILLFLSVPLISSTMLFFSTAYLGDEGNCMLRYLARWGEFEYWCTYLSIEDWEWHIDQCWHEIKDMPKSTLESLEQNYKLVSKSTEKWGCIFEYVDDKWNPIKYRYRLSSTIQCSVEKFLLKILPEPKFNDNFPFKFWG